MLYIEQRITQCLSCFCYLADTSLLQYITKLYWEIQIKRPIFTIFRESLMVSRDPYRMPVSRSPGHRWLRVFPWWLLTFSCKNSPPPAFRQGDKGTSGNAFIVRRKMCVLNVASGLTPLHDRIPAHFCGLSRENRRRENTAPATSTTIPSRPCALMQSRVRTPSQSHRHEMSILSIGAKPSSHSNHAKAEPINDIDYSQFQYQDNTVRFQFP